MNDTSGTEYRYMAEQMMMYSDAIFVKADDSLNVMSYYRLVKAEYPLVFNNNGFWMTSNENGIVIRPDYQMDPETYSAMSRTVQLKAASLAEEVRRDSEVETLAALNDTMCRSMRYEEGRHAHDVMGPLILGRGVCEGISHTVKLVCDILGIGCHPVFGLTGDVRSTHMWTLVRADGNWYNLDVTWDLNLSSSESVSRSYFLKTDEEFEHPCRNWRSIRCMRSRS